jgi:hypothetical protein
VTVGMTNSSKSKYRIQADTCTRLHIIVLYLLLAGLTMAWAIHFIHLSRTIRIQLTDYDDIKQRLKALESNEILISTTIDDNDPFNRQSRNTRSKVKVDQQQHEQADLLTNPIHFRVPVNNAEHR